MNLPAFTAERSLYTSARSYSGVALHRGGGDGLVPALSITYCRNPRAGWAIANTLCGECAEFQVYCIPRQGCFHRQVSGWKTECWPTEAYG